MRILRGRPTQMDWSPTSRTSNRNRSAQTYARLAVAPRPAPAYRRSFDEEAGTPIAAAVKPAPPIPSRSIADEDRLDRRLSVLGVSSERRGRSRPAVQGPDRQRGDRDGQQDERRDPERRPPDDRLEAVPARRMVVGAERNYARVAATRAGLIISKDVPRCDRRHAVTAKPHPVGSPWRLPAGGPDNDESAHGAARPHSVRTRPWGKALRTLLIDRCFRPSATSHSQRIHLSVVFSA